MKKIVLLTTIALSTLFIGCNDDDVQALGPSDTVVGFSSATKSQSFVVDQTDADLSIPVRLLSYANEQLPTEDITIQWQLVEPETYLDEILPEPQPEDYDTTEEYDEAHQAYEDEYAAQLATFGTLGTEFDLPSSTGSVTLTPDNPITELLVNVYPTSLVVGDAKKFVLELTSATNATVGYQYRRVLVTLNGACASNLEGDYILDSGGGVDAEFEVVGTGYYLVTSIYLPGNVWTGGGAIPYHMSDVCGIISIDDMILGGGYHMVGSGMVNGDGSITVTYSLEGTTFIDRTGTYYPN